MDHPGVQSAALHQASHVPTSQDSEDENGLFKLTVTTQLDHGYLAICVHRLPYKGIACLILRRLRMLQQECDNCVIVAGKQTHEPNRRPELSRACLDHSLGATLARSLQSISSNGFLGGVTGSQFRQLFSGRI